MKWVNLKKEKLKSRAKNNRNRRKFFKELKQAEDQYVYSIRENLGERRDSYVARV